MNFIKNGIQAINTARNRPPYRRFFAMVYFINLFTPWIWPPAMFSEIFFAENAVSAPEGTDAMISRDSREFSVP